MSNHELTRVAIRLVEACIAVCVVGRARLRWRAAPYRRPPGTLIARLADWHQGRVAGGVRNGQPERHRAPTSPTMARRGLFWPRLLVFLPAPVLVAGGVCAAPFKDALASRIDLRVEVLVRDGKITTYSAWYPSPPPNSSVATGQPPAGPRVAAGAAAVPPVTLFFLSTFGMLFAAALLLSVL